MSKIPRWVQIKSQPLANKILGLADKTSFTGADFTLPTCNKIYPLISVLLKNSSSRVIKIVCISINLWAKNKTLEPPNILHFSHLILPPFCANISTRCRSAWKHQRTWPGCGSMRHRGWDSIHGTWHSSQVYRDKLSDSKDLDAFDKAQKDFLKKKFEEINDAEIMIKPLIFCHFAKLVFLHFYIVSLHILYKSFWNQDWLFY